MNMLKISRILIAALLLLIPRQAFPFCFDDAGRTYGISPLLLRGIARVESNMKPGAVNHNSNGSIDLGLMQVNSFWLKTLGATSRELTTDPCYNVMAGAWILKGCLDRHGETWEAVGCYNATSRTKRVNYSWKIYRELLKSSKASAHAGGKQTAAVSNMPPLHGTARDGDSGDGNGKRKTIAPVSSIQISVVDNN
jgi:soluble lytic murein transglycosylase-like protein